MVENEDENYAEMNSDHKSGRGNNNGKPPKDIHDAEMMNWNKFNMNKNTTKGSTNGGGNNSSFNVMKEGPSNNSKYASGQPSSRKDHKAFGQTNMGRNNKYLSGGPSAVADHNHPINSVTAAEINMDLRKPNKRVVQ